MDFWKAHFGQFRIVVERIPWDTVLKNRVTERLDILQNENLTGTRAHCPLMLKDEMVEKKTWLNESGTFIGTQGNKRVFTSFGRRDRNSEELQEYC